MLDTSFVDLNNIFEYLKKSNDNYIEFYEKGEKLKKEFKNVYHDVLRVLSHLKTLHLMKGDRVAIIGTTCYEYVIVDLACVVMGVFTVPLDENKKYEIEDIVEEFKVSTVFTNLEFLDDRVVTFSVLCSNNETLANFIPARYEAEESFTTIFSSGTQGINKAVEVRAISFFDQFASASEMFDIGPKDKMLVFLPLNIYLERCYIYLAILHGFNLVIASPNYLFKVLKNDKITFTVGIPYFFESLYNLFMLNVQSDVTLQNKLADHLSGLKKIHDNDIVRVFKEFLGGEMRFFLTGSAPCKVFIIDFYHKMGVPLYEGYGMSEISGMLALNYPGSYRLGSVGKVFPNKEIMFDENEQILVRGKYIKNIRYFNTTKSINDQTFLAEGWIATGDIGYLDQDGYLFITGRIKDLLILSNGKKIHPGPVELRINTHDFIDNCVVVGNDRPYLTVLIVAKNKEIDKDAIHHLLREINDHLPKDERVGNFNLLAEPFSTENGTLLPSFKLNRTLIHQKFTEEIDSMYLTNPY
ncbi:AMP-binding protein [Pedobacter kyonggii]|uniref:AMP-dependent synthetase/ligase domain-containing protein n=1 Tax=Pedobacter kyonggii TaxID=1926871 RepID=A0A4Q9HGQ2_9SPHI|nr:AMP-binding protein [Pedobacter kyonggii]TBO44295.1 hypothetical protein EYS08_03000 [Pedobacter kyonggii]